MNLNIYDLLRSNVALVMNLLLGSVGICITIGTALEARRPLWLLALYIIGKGFFSSIYIPALAACKEEYQAFQLISAIILPWLGCAVICIFFKGGIVKPVFTFMVCEIELVLFNFGSLGLISWIAPGKMILFPLVWIVLFATFYLCCRPYLKKWRDYEIRHKRVLGSLLAVYLLVSSFSYLMGLFDFSRMAFWLCLTMSSFLLLTGAIFLLFLRQNQKKDALEQEYLRMQQSLMETRYAALRREGNRDYGRLLQEMEQHMGEITRIKDAAARSESVRSYLAHLKAEYHVIYPGTYCDESMIDAVLTSQAQRLKKQGIAFRCSCQGYECGQIEELDLAQLLLWLLELAGKERTEWTWTAMDGKTSVVSERAGEAGVDLTAAGGKPGAAGVELTAASEKPSTAELSVHLATLKGRLLIRLSWKGMRGPGRFRKPRWMKSCLKKYNGMVYLNNRDAGKTGSGELIVGLQTTESKA